MIGRALTVLLILSTPVFAARPKPTAAAPAPAQVDSIATVDGEGISYAEFNRKLATAMRYRQKEKPSAVPDPANVQMVKESTLEELVIQTLLYQEALRQKVEVSQSELDQAVEEIKGRFTRDDEGRELTAAQAQDAFETELKTQGETISQFHEGLRRQIAIRKLIKARAMGEPELKAYVAELRGRAKIVRRPFPASSSSDSAEAAGDAPASETKAPSTKPAGKQWWDK